MGDLVCRLRKERGLSGRPITKSRLCCEAADEIERLTAEVLALRSTADYYKEQLDEIQRILGFLSAKNYIGRAEESTVSGGQECNHSWVTDNFGPTMWSKCGVASNIAAEASIADSKQWTPCEKHGEDQSIGEDCEYCEIEADLKQRQEHHIACCFQVTGGLEPCDYPLSTDEKGQVQS